MNNQLQKELLEAGLTENEAAVFLAALELGETTASRLARKADIKRTTTYLVLESLKEKGLISSLKKETGTVFFAENPQKLHDILERRREKIDKIMPQLLAFTNLIDKKPEIRYFEGANGIKEVFFDTLKHPGSEILFMFSESYQADFGDDFLDNQYRPKRLGLKIPARMLVPDNAQMRSMKTDTSLRQIKFLAPNLFKIKIEIIIYKNNKLGIISFKESFAIIIESSDIHDSFKGIFETLWASVK